MKKTFKRVLSTVLALCVLLASATCLMGMSASAETTPSVSESTDTTVFVWEDAPLDQYLRFGGCGNSALLKGIADVLWGQEEGETVRISFDYYNPEGGAYEVRKNTVGSYDWGDNTLTLGSGLGSMDVYWTATNTNAGGCVEPMLHSLGNNSGKTLYIWNIHIWAHHYKNGAWHDVEFSGDEITHLYPSTATSTADVFPETTLDKVPVDTESPEDIFAINASATAGIYYFILKNPANPAKPTLQDATWHNYSAGDTITVKFDYFNTGHSRLVVAPYNKTGYVTNYSGSDNTDVRLGFGRGQKELTWISKGGNHSFVPTIEIGEAEGYNAYLWNFEITVDCADDSFDRVFTSEDIASIRHSTGSPTYTASTNYENLAHVYKYAPTDSSTPLNFYTYKYDNETVVKWRVLHKPFADIVTAAEGDEIEVSFDYYIPNFNDGSKYQVTTADSSAARFDHALNLTAGKGSVSETFTVTEAGALQPIFKYLGNTASEIYIWNQTVKYHGKSYSLSLRTTAPSTPTGWGAFDAGTVVNLASMPFKYNASTMTEISFADDATGELTTSFAPVTLVDGVDYTLTFDYFMSSDMDNCYIDGIDTQLKAGKNTYTGTITGTGAEEYITLVTNSKNYPSKLYIYNMKLTSEYGTLSFGEHAGISIGEGATYSRVFIDDFWFKADDNLKAGDEIVDTEPTDVPLDITPGSKVFVIPEWTSAGGYIGFGGTTAFGFASNTRWNLGLHDYCWLAAGNASKEGESVRIKLDYYNPEGASYGVRTMAASGATTPTTQSDCWIGTGYGTMDVTYSVNSGYTGTSFAAALEVNGDNTGKPTYFWNIEITVVRFDESINDFVEKTFKSATGDIEWLFAYSTFDANHWLPTPYEEVPFVNTWTPESTNQDLPFYASKWNGLWASTSGIFKTLVPSTTVGKEVNISFDYYINNPAADGKYVLTTEKATAAFDRAVNLSAGKGSVSETFTITQIGPLQPVIKYIGDTYSDINIWNVKVSYDGKAYPVSFNGLTASSFNDTTVYEQLDYMTEISFADEANGEQSASMKPVTLVDGEEYTVSFNYFLSGDVDSLYVDGIEDAKLKVGKNTYLETIVGDGSDFTFKIVGNSESYPAKLYVSSVTVTSDTDTRNFGAKAVWSVADQDTVSTKTLFYDEEWFTMNNLDSSLVFGDANSDGKTDVLDMVYSTFADSKYKDIRAVDYDKNYTVDENDTTCIRGEILGIKEKRVIILTDAHLNSMAEQNRYGYTAEERIDIMIDRLKQYDRRNPFDEIIYLGDLSLDFLGEGTGDYQANGQNYSKKFVDLLREETGKTCYFIPGNHDVYDNDTWKEFVGEDRQFSFVSGGYLFIACDNFEDAQGRDWVYSTTDVAFIEQEMAKYPDLPVVILAHGFKMANESAEFKELLKNDRIVGLFQGHDHMAYVEDLSSYDIDKTIYHAGQFFYTDKQPLGTQMWGFCDVILGADGINVKYIEPSVVYEIDGSRINYPYTESLEHFMPVK